MKRLRFLVVYFAAWIPVAAIYSLLIYFSSRERQLSSAITGGVQSVAFAAFLGLAVVWATRLMAERTRPLKTLIGIHAGFAVAYSIVWTGLVVLSIALFAPPWVLTMFLEYALGWELLTGMLFYGMVAGITHGVTVGARLRRVREAAIKSDALRARAELSALRAQMNPHFLFNTLHSISALVRSDPRAAEDALERLALLLRRLLDLNRSGGGGDHVSLAQEWEIVRDQLELEKLRFGDRLNVVTEIDGEALECQIPIFTLQPLVENAVRHGLGGQTQRCTIAIAAHVRADVLEMEVRDDGPGSDARAALSAPGLGLRSVRQRLLAQYGDRAGVHLETAPGKGFFVRVTLPAVVVAAASHETRGGTTGAGAAVATAS